MLTLEQVRAVNDGFHDGDLNAALQPLEATIDLRANELPRLDKKAVATLKKGLADGDDAATWAQAILHPNVSVRRFARKIFMGLGDEAAPVFDPLRARLERFWGEEAPLPFSNKPREAALRREQNEQIESALEILLRADPEQFMAFYACLADAAPSPNQPTDAMIAWRDQSANVWAATAQESDRLLRQEWGEKWLDGNQRWKLPSRVLRDLDERARQNPEIARLWEQLGDNPWENIAPEWNSADAVRSIWSGYLNKNKTTAPVERVNARLRPILWRWVEGAIDPNRAMSERETLANRLMRDHFSYYLGAWLGCEIVSQKVPALLTASKPALLKSLQSVGKRSHGHYDTSRQTGKHLIASTWLVLAGAICQTLFKPHHLSDADWQMPDIAPQLLLDLAEGLPTTHKEHVQDYGIAATLRRGAETIEKARQGEADADEREEFAGETEAKTEAADELLFDALASLYRHVSYGSEPEREKVERLKQAILALDDEARVAHLVAPPERLAGSQRAVPRGLYWQVWARELGSEGAEQLETTLWPRAKPQLWARLEEQLQAHRKMETEPIEPDVKRKLTEREAKDWRAQVRAQKRGVIAGEVIGIAQFLAQMDGVAAQIKAIALADRPSCREIRNQLEGELFYYLETYPEIHQQMLFPMANWQGNFPGSQSVAATPEDWQNWKLGELWDPVLEKMEARLESAKDRWQRVTLERQLASGFYRRGNFANFERYATQSESFPMGVAKAAVIFDDFEAWRVLLNISNGWNGATLAEFWRAQQSDETRRKRAIEAVVKIVAATASEDAAKSLLRWLAPLDVVEFEPLVCDVEDALESAIVPVKKWALKILAALPGAEFDRERAAQTAGEMLWSENAGLAKDAAKFLSVLALQADGVAAVAWDALGDATSLDNIGVCEAVYRALVKIKSKRKNLELSDAAREKLKLLGAAQSERFGKFGGKLVSP